MGLVQMPGARPCFGKTTPCRVAKESGRKEQHMDFHRRLMAACLFALPMVAVSAFLSSAQTFQDPSMRGSLTDMDGEPRVPQLFQGRWRWIGFGCQVSGMTIDIGETAVNEARVRRVQGYSDDETAVMVDLGTEVPSGRSEPNPERRVHVFLELSLDATVLRVRSRAERQPFQEVVLLQRCFPRSTH
jgi:hypothetical protein